MITYHINDMENNKEYVIAINSKEREEYLKNFKEIVELNFSHFNEENKKNLYEFKNMKMLLHFLVSYINDYLRLTDQEKYDIHNNVTRNLLHFCAAFSYGYDKHLSIQLTCVSIFKNGNKFSCNFNSHCSFSDD